MKYLLISLLCLYSLTIHGQQPEFDGHKWEAPYYLPVPKDWGVERFLIPINFAPGIPYKGVEDIRFAPGWAKIKTEEYWTYAFLWYLDGSVKMDAAIIAQHLKEYYTGLYLANTRDSSRNAAITSFKKIPVHKDDQETYKGTIEMTDYIQKKPITLNCIVHIKTCASDNKTIVFYELSPKPFTHNNWLALDQLWADFKCKKN